MKWAERQSTRTARLPEAHALHPTPTLLEPFSLHNVSLLPGTRFYEAQQTNLRWLQMLEPDRLLYFFREQAGLPRTPHVKPHGGWDGAGMGLRGHIAGHWLSAASMAAATTGDATLRRHLELVTRGLHECQEASSDGYLSGFPQGEFAQMETLPTPPNAWVPYYVMHKLLAGLLDYHRLWRSVLALEVARRLAEHVRMRVEHVRSLGDGRWELFINQEVGGMSEVLTDLALATRNATWLTLAASFERPCFVGPLALDYQVSRQAQHEASPSAPSSLAARAIERMHGNTHLPQLLGTMRRYEATGVPALRGAAEAFWRELSDGHMFATGGSTVSETWRGAATLGDAVSQHGHSAFGGHDTHETCVSHNSMRVSRRLLSWGADGDGGEDGGGGGGGGGSSGSSSGGSSSCARLSCASTRPLRRCVSRLTWQSSHALCRRASSCSRRCSSCCSARRTQRLPLAPRRRSVARTPRRRARRCPQCCGRCTPIVWRQWRRRCSAAWRRARRCACSARR